MSSSSGRLDDVYLLQELKEGTIALHQMFSGEHGGEAALISLESSLVSRDC